MNPVTNALVAKRALIGRLQAEATGGLLRDIAVDYAFNANAGDRSIYAGGWRMTADDAVAEGPGILIEEAVTVSLYIRIVSRAPDRSVEQTDQDAEEVGAVIGRILRNNPRLSGDLAVVGIISGQGDYEQTDDETWSIHAYGVQVRSHLSYG